ncbi:MAG: hypothetical protein HY727_02885 [Candidatus Rokubacteria bacterium]|nr:hypothetical protein [Candidatus Rokubacteria bacterium]
MRLAAHGVRNLDAGDEPIDDPGLAGALRRRARAVHIEAALVALVLTGLALLLPS